VGFNEVRTRTVACMLENPVYCVIAVGRGHHCVPRRKLLGAHHSLDPCRGIAHEGDVGRPRSKEACDGDTGFAHKVWPATGKEGDGLGFYVLSPAGLCGADRGRNRTIAAMVEKGPGRVQQKLAPREAWDVCGLRNGPPRSQEWSVA